MKGFLKFVGTVVVSVAISALLTRECLLGGTANLKVRSIEVHSSYGEASLYPDGISVWDAKGERIFFGILDGRPAYKHTREGDEMLVDEKPQVIF